MIRKAKETDVSILTELALRLWPHHTAEEFFEEFVQLIPRQDVALFLAYEDTAAIGFAQCQLRRDYVEGTESSPVGYLEGIYVSESQRGKGMAKALLRACEDWAREQGCSEFASDCELDNAQSLRFHLSVGFREANRVICFTKKL